MNSPAKFLKLFSFLLDLPSPEKLKILEEILSEIDERDTDEEEKEMITEIVCKLIEKSLEGK